MNSLESFNQAVFLDINGTASSPHWVINLALVSAKYLVIVIPLLLIFMWLSGGQQRREMALRATVVAVLALLFNLLIGFIWPHPRPFAMGLGQQLLAHAANSSFPSNHAAGGAAVAVTMLIRRVWGPALVAGIVTLAMAWARIFVGIHFPLDMLGALIVAFVAYLVVSPFWLISGHAITLSLVTLYRFIFALPIRMGWVRS